MKAAAVPLTKLSRAELTSLSGSLAARGHLVLRTYQRGAATSGLLLAQLHTHQFVSMHDDLFERCRSLGRQQRCAALDCSRWKLLLVDACRSRTTAVAVSDFSIATAKVKFS